jgi:cytochrome c556
LATHRNWVIFSAAVLLLVGAGVATARTDASNPIAARHKILKGMGRATKPVVLMLKGEATFNRATVLKTLEIYIDGSKKLPSLFPVPPKPGQKTEALPKIWQNKARFNALYAKLAKDSAAAKVSIVDEASLRAHFRSLLGDCKTCHDDFRRKN